MGIVVHAVGAYQPFRTTWLYLSVSSDYVVVADTQLPVVILAMPRIYLSGRTGLVGPHRRTMDNNQCDGSHNYSLFTFHYSLFHAGLDEERGNHQRDQ
jgi:hypothetical protein